MKLQNNFTTPEQSKRLLKLGVPADSADCYYHTRQRSKNSVIRTEFNVIEDGMHGWHTFTEMRDICVGNDIYRENRLKHYLPCWSVGRMIEILETCWTDRIESPIWYNHHGKGRTIIEMVLWDFENRRLDFSKLEE